MSQLPPDLARAVAERVRFYRELGIYDLYRRDLPESAATTMTNASAPTTLPVLPQSVEEQLAAIREDIGDCTRCRLHAGRTNLVFGVGNPRADLMFVGEGPGADEDAQGEPFVGRAGQLLNNMIKAMGLRREDVYIANVVKCRPPGNRQPERDEAETCGRFLMGQIAAIRPKIVVALGATAAKYLLGLNESMAALRGNFYDILPAAGTEPVKVAVTYHPAYLLRDPRQKAETWKDLQQVMKFLGLSAPAKS
jgi:DNA polymerase